MTPGPLFAGVLDRPEGLWLLVTAVFGAASLAACVVVSIFHPASSRTLARALEPYLDLPAGPGSAAAGGDGADPWAETALSRRAIGVAEDIARRRGVLDRMERLLAQADIKLRPGEILFFGGTGAVLLAVLAGLLISPGTGVVSLFLLCAAQSVAIRRKAKKRLRRFVRQLPDTLTLLAGTLKAGYSLLQGADAVAREVEEPMAGELRRILAEAQLGLPIEQALEECAARMQSPDFEWAVMGINIQREVGGNLAELLSTIAQTMTERERLRREVLSLTAEGRVSASVLGGLAPGLGLIMWLANPKYVGPLLTTGSGHMLLLIAGSWAMVGFVAMKKIVTIEA